MDVCSPRHENVHHVLSRNFFTKTTTQHHKIGTTSQDHQQQKIAFLIVTPFYQKHLQLPGLEQKVRDTHRATRSDIKIIAALSLTSRLTFIAPLAFRKSPSISRCDYQAHLPSLHNSSLPTTVIIPLPLTLNLKTTDSLLATSQYG